MLKRSKQEHMIKINYLKFLIITVLSFGLLCGCVYKLEVQQGNLIDIDDLESVNIGMTPRQVIYLLGSPVLDDPLQNDHWNYIYYKSDIENNNFQPQGVTIFFENGVVSRVDQSNINP